MPTATRVFNFSAGPAVLPLPVLEEAQRDLIALPGVGMSVMEISHRSKTFEDLMHKAQDDIRALAGVPASYRILMLQGGASLQFSMVPLNLLGLGANIVDGLIGLAIFGGSLAGLSLWKPQGMGMGDAKLAALIGLVLGSLGLRYVEFAAVVAFALGSIWAVALLAITRRGGHTKLAFAPLLAAGGLVACVLAWMS